ncbi:MAG: hypothetical protein R2735_12710 [Microthrixaceae bacterium]
MAANSAFNTRKSPLNELPATHRKRTQFKWAAASVMISAGLIVGACSGSSGDSQSQRPDRERQEMRNVDQRSGDQGNQQNQGDQGNRPAGEGVANAKSATGEPFEMVPIPCQPEGEHQWYRTDDTFVVDPSNPETMYVNVEYKGLFKSTDGGKTWARKTKGLVVDHRNATTNEPCYTEYPVAVIDPTNPKRILLATSGGGGGTINDPNMRGGGVYESTDGGEHWKQMINGEMNGYVTHALVLDPNDPKTVYYGSAASPASYREADPNEIWVTKGIIYKTVDNGKKWEELPTGFEKYMRLSFIAVDPADSKRITASTVLMSPGNGGPNVLGDNPLGIIQSTDGGASWNRVDNLPKGYETRWPPLRRPRTATTSSRSRRSTVARSPRASSVLTGPRHGPNRRRTWTSSSTTPSTRQATGSSVTVGSAPMALVTWRSSRATTPEPPGRPSGHFPPRSRTSWITSHASRTSSSTRAIRTPSS